MPELLTLAPGIEVPKPDDGAGLRYNQAAVERVETFFSMLVFGQNDWAGKPFELLPWERDLIRQFYGIEVKDDDGRWVRYRRFLYNEIPKKNGKSELAAGLGLYHLLADGEQKPGVGILPWTRRTPISFTAALRPWWRTPSLGSRNIGHWHGHAPACGRSAPALADG